MAEPSCNDAHEPPKKPASVDSVKRNEQNTPSLGRWQAPDGVAAGTWDYVNRDHIGDQYDAFVEGEPLNGFDREIFSRYLPKLPPTRAGAGDSIAEQTPIVIDFGAGTGRTLLPLVRDGYRGIAVDLSESMLRNLREKMLSEFGQNCPVAAIQANLVELEGLSSDSADHGVCMLSTLGMIQQATYRAKFLQHVRRIVRPNGLFFVHAHNYFYQWRYPGGLRWAAKNAWDSLRGKAEIGDRLATYRQVSGMFIHQFRRSEISRALTEAGFPSHDFFGVEPGSTQPVPIRNWHNPFRFVGWVVVGRSGKAQALQKTRINS